MDSRATQNWKTCCIHSTHPTGSQHEHSYVKEWFQVQRNKSNLIIITGKNYIELIYIYIYACNICIYIHGMFYITIYEG